MGADKSGNEIDGGRIQRDERLVKQPQRAPFVDEARQGDASLLALRQVAAGEVFASGEAQGFQRVEGAILVERGIGDVLIAWENEAYLAVKELGPDKFDIVTPSLSILAEPPVSVVDKVVDKRGTRKVATAYLEYLYSPEGQTLAGDNYYRPRDTKIAAKYAKQFAPVKLFTIDEVFGGWANAQKTHFADGGLFDEIKIGRAHV